MMTVRALRASDRGAFMEVMAAAFRWDPLIVAAIGERPEALRAFLSFMFDMTMLVRGRRLGVFEGERLAGCVLVEPPEGRGLVDGLRLVGAAIRFLPVALRLPRTSTALFNRYLNVTRAAAPREPHAYLTMVGVDPRHQGKGFGRVLIEAAADAAAEMGAVGVALDTENPVNVPLYGKLGFIQTVRLELGPFTSFCMYRSIR